VEVLGRTGLLYREADRKMFIDSEVLMGPSGMAIYKASIVRWDSPHDNEELDKTDQDRILTNIREAFRFQGFEVQTI